MKELIHFTADWCGPCKKMTPVIEDFLKNNKDVHYDRVDVDVDLDKVERYDILSVPTLISKVDGKIYDRVSGVVSEFKLKSMFG